MKIEEAVTILKVESVEKIVIFTKIVYFEFIAAEPKISITNNVLVWILEHEKL